jgi:hypothetical protein
MRLNRRSLTFLTLDDAVRDADTLLVRGYDRVGQWDLGQVCRHLALWLSYPVEGFPKAPLLLKPFFWAFRKTLAPGVFRKALASGTMKAGLTTIPQSVPKPGDDTVLAVAAFRNAVARWTNHTGPVHPSPLFGSVSREHWTQAHLIHSAHHLSFLLPKASEDPITP